MKNSLIVLIILLSNTLYSQVKLVKTITENTGFCSNSMFLYSDSTFAYERGCEGGTAITFGKYSMDKDIILLTQRQPRNVITAIEIVEVSKEPDSLHIAFAASNDSIVWLEIKTSSIEGGKNWVQSDTIIKPQALTTISETNYIGELLVHHNPDSVSVCLTRLYKIFQLKKTVDISSKTSFLLIRTNLPFEIMKLCAIYTEMKYVLLETSSFKLEDQLFLVMN